MTEERTLQALEFYTVRDRIAKFCSFSAGREMIEQMQPESSYLGIREQLAYTRDALDLVNQFGPMPLGGIHEIRPALNLASKGGIIGIGDLLNIVSHNAAVHACIGYMDNHGRKDGPIRELTDSLSTVDGLCERINRCIGADGSILDHASEDLARIRRSLNRSQKELDQAVRGYMNTHHNRLQDDISAVRNDRQVVLVKASEKNALGGIQYDESASGAAVYMEPSELVPYNNAVQEARQKEAREIERILRELSRLVKGQAVQLSANMETLALLDAYFAKAEYGHAIGGCAPKISEGDDLVIENGYHPLLDPQKAVRNTYHLVHPYRMLLITGPNTGGKTVTMKTIGLFCLLTYAGCPVSADRAVIPLYSRIIVDIGDNQSIAESLSTFSAHIAILTDIFHKADARSLVLIDELASGTDPREGESLAVAILESFRKRQIFFIGSTHYEKLKAYARQHTDILIASMAFDMTKLEPTFQYREGTVGQSNAFDIAERYGFPKDVLDRARQLKQQDQTEGEKLMEKLNAEQQQLDQKQKKLDELLQENRMLKEQMSQEKQQFEAERADLLTKAQQEADEQIENKLQEADEVIRQLKEQSTYNLPETVKARTKISQLAQREEIRQSVDPANIKPGDLVRIVANRQVGRVISIKGNQVTLDMHGMTVKTSIDGIRKEASLKLQSTPKRQSHLVPTESFPSEINLIGMRTSEALPVLDKYLDEAVVHHCLFVRVIHGFGTGRLRAAVWSALKKNKAVDHFEAADPANGGAGATLVYFKGARL